MLSHQIPKDISRELVDAYLDYIVPKFQSFNLKIVIDAFQGATSNVAPLLFKKCGCEVDEINCKINGNFTKYDDGPDPGNEKYIKELINEVTTKCADLGFAYDGDGDRLAVVDSDGKVIQPDIYTIVLLKAFNMKQDDKVVMDVRCSQTLVDYVRKNGGQEVYAACGPTALIGLMRRKNGLLGCETTGHIYFNEDPIIFDDPLFATYRLVEYLSQPKQKLSSILESIPQYCSVPEERISYEEVKDGEVKEEDIFREYDIRGEVGPKTNQVNRDLMKKIGQAFGSYIKRDILSPKILVSYDPRPKSCEFQQAVMEGLIQTGCSVINGGMLPTSIYSFAISHKKADAGMHVTASHNPRKYNGIKIRGKIRGLYDQFGGEKLQELKQRIFPENYVEKNAENSNIDEVNKLKAIEIVKQKLRQDPSVIDLVEVDGVKAFFEKGWGLLRASNTQPQLTMRFEATEKKELPYIVEKFRGIILGLPGIDDNKANDIFDKILA